MKTKNPAVFLISQIFGCQEICFALPWQRRFVLHQTQLTWSLIWIYWWFSHSVNWIFWVWVFRLLQISGSNDGITELTRTGHKCDKKSNKSYCKKKEKMKKRKRKKKGKQMVVKQRASTTLPFSLYIFTCDLDVFFSLYVCVWGMFW